MQIIPFNSVLEHNSKGVCAALGVFDGVHLGHQSVIAQVLKDARQMRALPLVITFDKHPISVLNPAKAPQMIYPLEAKLSLLEKLGIEKVMLIPFNEKIASLSAPDFFKIISTNLFPLLSISMGTGFVFARNRTGNIKKLREMAVETGTIVQEVPSVCVQEEKISSSQIRIEISRGNFEKASQMLGRPYSIISNVVVGDQIGRTIGYPTANLSVVDRAIPPTGVYAVTALIGERQFQGCMNIGLRPTLGCSDPKPRVEVCILNFNEDIYGKTIEVIPLKRLRDEKKFASLDTLRLQIAQDIKLAQSVFSEET
ncbi:MAG: bifunctional riboflavin kinase/FAD synthetase [Verrucomicrobiae bacterium]|nr:bifunctional riboflavin kinase/FAD synthetase [Verrucomicrobiae bacterium]